MSAIEVTPTEVIDLHADEEIIERGLQSFVEVGQALQRIRDERKYKASGFQTFEDYCQQRWGMGRSQAYHLIDSSQMCTIVHISPASESQVRPLVSLAKKDATLAAAAWSRAVETAEGDQPTAKQVKAAVEEVAPKPETEKPQADPNGNRPMQEAELVNAIRSNVQAFNKYMSNLTEERVATLTPKARKHLVKALREVKDLTETIEMIESL